jgi:DNA-binding NarL/FixJ family response regulator
MNFESDSASILVVAEHALVRAGLRALLDGTPGLTVAAEATSVSSAVKLARSHRPDVVLLDAPPAEARARAAIADLRRELPRACVLCLARGADDLASELRCVPPDAGVDEFCTALSSVLGERCGACLLRPSCVAPRLAIALSPREKQVAVRIAEGMSSKQIAAALGVALRTVNTYRESLAKKLGASSAAVVTRFVLEQGL